MNGKHMVTRIGQALLATILIAGAIPDASAQSATGFLGLAGVVRDSGNNALNNIEIRVRNRATGRTEVTTTPTTPPTVGFYFVALTDFSGNRAAQQDDVLELSAFNTSTRAQLKATPATVTVTSGDVSSSLRKFDISVDTATQVDTTPPSIRITFSAADTNNVAAGQLTITAVASELITLTAAVKIEITDPQGVKTAPTPVQRTDLPNPNPTSSQFSVAYTVNATNTGVYTVAVTGANDNAGNANLPATNNSFRVQASGGTSTNPDIAVARVKGKGSVIVPVNISTAGKAIGSLQFKILFDPAQVTFTAADPGQAAVASGYQIAFNVNPANLLNVTIFGTADAGLQGGEAIRLTWNTLTTADNSVISLHIQNIDVSDTGAVTIAATGEDGAITVGATSNPVPRPGQICFDVNNNGTPAESADITYLLNKSINRVVTRNSVTTDFRVCPAGTNNNGDQTCFDINQNGTPAESADITYLLNKSINRVVTRNSVTTDFRTCPAYTGP